MSLRRSEATVAIRSPPRKLFWGCGLPHQCALLLAMTRIRNIAPFYRRGEHCSSGITAISTSGRPMVAPTKCYAMRTAYNFQFISGGFYGLRHSNHRRRCHRRYDRPGTDQVSPVCVYSGADQRRGLRRLQGQQRHCARRL